MSRFISGVIVGIVLSGSLGIAGTLYDSKGQPNAPKGSVQQYDYFRGRQQQLDVSAMRRQLEHDRLDVQGKPCAR